MPLSLVTSEVKNRTLKKKGDTKEKHGFLFSLSSVQRRNPGKEKSAAVDRDRELKVSRITHGACRAFKTGRQQTKTKNNLTRILTAAAVARSVGLERHPALGAECSQGRRRVGRPRSVSLVSAPARGAQRSGTGRPNESKTEGKRTRRAVERRLVAIDAARSRKPCQVSDQRSKCAPRILYRLALVARVKCRSAPGIPVGRLSERPLKTCNSRKRKVLKS